MFFLTEQQIEQCHVDHRQRVEQEQLSHNIQIKKQEHYTQLKCDQMMNDAKSGEE